VQLAEEALRRFANLVMRNHGQATFSDTEIGEAVDFVVRVERQPWRRILREVLALRGYDRNAKRFLIGPVFDVKNATACSAPRGSPLLCFYGVKLPRNNSEDHPIGDCACQGERRRKAHTKAGFSPHR